MGALTSFVLRHRRLVGLAWPGESRTTGTSGLSVPPLWYCPMIARAAASLRAPGISKLWLRWPPSFADPAPPRTSRTSQTAYQPQVISDLRAGFAAVADAVPGRSRVTSYASTGNRSFVAADGRTAFGLVFTPSGIGYVVSRYTTTPSAR
jgi:hypothetical protein